MINYNIFNSKTPSLDLLPVYVENSQIKIDSITLRKFQDEFRNSSTHWNILQTPTGSGKTLAVLTKILFNTKSKKGIFIYPTNELIQDQLIALEKLIKKLGKKTKIVNTEILNSQNKDWIQKLSNDLRTGEYIVLFAINGATLYELSLKEKEPKGKVLFNILNILNRTDTPSIMLTNFDTLFLIIKNKYKDNTRILDLIINWRHVVIDEFHLYSGISLFNLICTLLLFYIFISRHYSGDYSINLLSATPSDTLNFIKDIFKEDILVVQTKKKYSLNNLSSLKFSEIRKSTKIFFFGRSGILYTSNDRDFLYNIVQAIINLPEFNKKKELNKNVRLLILVNSMIFAEKFYKFLKKRFEEENIKLFVKRIHGMIPPIKREKIEEMKNCVLIGTRAIEIGIDFDVSFLIFEAFDIASFLQRFGRGGRHDECVQVCLTSNLFVNKIYTNIENEKKSLDDLIKFASETLIEEKTYFELIYSVEGLALLRPFLESLTNNEEEQLDFLNELNSLIKTNSQSIPIEKWKTCFRNLAVRRYLKNMISARCNLIDFPCYFEEFNFWSKLSLSELGNCNFKISSYQNLQNRNPRLIWKRYSNQPVIHILNFKEKKSKLKIGTVGKSLPSGKIFFSSIHKLHLEGDLKINELEILNKILSEVKMPFIITDAILDWRIPQFLYLDNPNLKIILGENAFLTKYLMNKE